jgi:hypothetical protein
VQDKLDDCEKARERFAKDKKQAEEEMMKEL